MVKQCLTVSIPHSTLMCASVMVVCIEWLGAYVLVNIRDLSSISSPAGLLCVPVPLQFIVKQSKNSLLFDPLNGRLEDLTHYANTMDKQVVT